jgi:hypothetical protein
MAVILTTTQNTAGSSNNVLAGQRVIDMDETIHLLEPSDAPLTVFTKRAGQSEDCFNPAFNWLEDVLLPRVSAFDGAGYTSVVTTLNVTPGDGTKFNTYDLLTVPTTGEIILVTAIVTDALTVTRAFGVTAAAAIAPNADLMIIGNAQIEGATSRNALATQTVEKTNYAQIFRTPLGWTRTLQDSKLYGGKYAAYQTKKVGIEHRVEIERSFLWGEPYQNLTSTGGQWATGGLNYWIQTNRIDGGGALTYASFERMCETVFRYGNQKQRLGISSPAYISKVDLLAEARLFFQTTTEVYGVRINRIQTSHGDVMLVKHPLMQDVPEYNERAFILDMDKIKQRPFVNASTKLKQNIQAPDVDGRKDEYITQTGLQVENQLTHAVHFNVA